MNKSVVEKIASLRLIIGYLGEKNQHNWWSSSFLTPSAKAYLAPIFPRTMLQAQHRGVSAAAALVHDEFIGVGSNYHLFRLPETVELELDRYFQSSSANEHVSVPVDEQGALQALLELSGDKMSTQEGPVLVDDYDAGRLSTLIQQTAGLYLSAFENSTKCYPFMREAA